MRTFALFLALLFTALVAGGAFVIWIEYNPAGMSPAFYTEQMQHGIRIFTVPLPTIVVLSTLCTVLSAFLARRQQPIFRLLLVASACAVGVILITAFGHIPINNQVKGWNPVSPPENWNDVGLQWWRLQSARTIVAVAGLVFLILAALRRAEGRT